jgi:hypothetical protein
VGQTPEKTEPLLPGMRGSTNLICWVAVAFSMTLLPFLRSGMGKRGIGLPGVFAFILILGYASLAPEMIVYLWAWLAMVIYRKLTYDPLQHTEYGGRCVLTDWLFHNEMTSRLAEAGLVWAIGNVLSDLSPAIGQFVTWDAYALWVNYMLENAVIERQKEAAHDAITTMQIQQERMEEVTRRR